MKRSKFFVVFCVASIVAIATAVTVLAQAPVKGNITFTKPAKFACGAAISWNDLKDWKGGNDTSICGSEPFYTVTGKVADPNAYRVKAEIYVPEAKQSWPTSGGAFRLVDKTDGTFTGNFCIPSKGPEREFWFQVFAQDKTPIGEKCVIKVASEW